MRQCEFCGNKIYVDSMIYCSTCGEPLSSAAMPQQKNSILSNSQISTPSINGVHNLNTSENDITNFSNLNSIVKSKKLQLCIVQWGLALFGGMTAFIGLQLNILNVLSSIIIVVSSLFIMPLIGMLVDKKILFLKDNPALKIILQFLISFIIFVVGIVISL